MSRAEKLLEALTDTGTSISAERGIVALKSANNAIAKNDLGTVVDMVASCMSSLGLIIGDVELERDIEDAVSKKLLKFNDLLVDNAVELGKLAKKL